MTTALCTNCGSLKFGALCQCKDCGCCPTETSSLDVAFTDHYLTENTLTQFGDVLRFFRTRAADEAQAFWAFIGFVSSNYPEIVFAQIPRKYRGAVDALLQLRDIPAVIVEDSPRIDVVERSDPISQYLSRVRHHLITCERCGTPQSFAVWSRINGSIDDWVKLLITSGHLFAVRCPECNHTRIVPYDSLYIDIERFAAIWLSHPADQCEFPIANPTSEELFSISSDFSLRRVGTAEGLAEKVTILEHGIDDITVECTKLALCIQHGIDITEPMYFDSVERSLIKGKSFVFELPRTETRMQYSLRANKSAMAHIVQSVSPTLHKINSNWPALDRSQLLRTLEKTGMMRPINVTGT